MLSAVEDVAFGSEDGPFVFAVSGDDLTTLAEIATIEQDELNRLAESWAKTEEFDGWDFADVHDLVLSIGDLAETAKLQDKSL